jgi:hypothetical protein
MVLGASDDMQVVTVTCGACRCSSMLPFPSILRS